jgi:hypothetical protein
VAELLVFILVPKDPDIEPCKSQCCTVTRNTNIQQTRAVIRVVLRIQNFGSQNTSNNHTTIQKTAGPLPVSSRAYECMLIVVLQKENLILHGQKQIDPQTWRAIVQ